jgi:signal transduction histidine kinase
VLFALGIAVGWIGARARLLRSKRTEREHLSQVAMLLNALPQAALTTDREARLLAQNGSAIQLLRELKWDSHLPLTVDAGIGRVVRTGVAESMEIASAEKPTRRVQVTIAPLRAAGLDAEALLLLADLSALSNRAEFNQRLISTVAHEVRTPLTAIMGHVEILNSCGIEEEALWRRSLGFVSSETERLARLIEDLLSLSRLDRISLHLKPVNLRVAAEEAISSLFDSVERNNVTPVFQAPPDLPRVLADADRIRQVFLNLLDNAIKYAPGSTITIRLTPEAERVRVEVSDSGPGIPQGDLSYIFEPFWRGEQVASGSKGTGLGLTIVRAILDQHQAPIRVQSETGQGSNFIFSLPIARSAKTG